MFRSRHVDYQKAIFIASISAGSFSLPISYLFISPFLYIYVDLSCNRFVPQTSKAIKFSVFWIMTSPFFFVFLFSSLHLLANVDANPNYREALSKSLLFFQGQRSGPLPRGQQLSWRSSSGLSDGSSAHVHLKPFNLLYTISISVTLIAN